MCYAERRLDSGGSLFGNLEGVRRKVLVVGRWGLGVSRWASVLRAEHSTLRSSLSTLASSRTKLGKTRSHFVLLDGVQRLVFTAFPCSGRYKMSKFCPESVGPPRGVQKSVADRNACPTNGCAHRRVSTARKCGDKTQDSSGARAFCFLQGGAYAAKEFSASVVKKAAGSGFFSRRATRFAIAMAHVTSRKRIPTPWSSQYVTA